MKEFTTEKRNISFMWEGVLQTIEVDHPVGYHKVEDDRQIMVRGDMFFVPLTNEFEFCPPSAFRAGYYLYPIAKD